MVFVERREVIMTAPMNAYQSDLTGIYCLQLFTVLNRNEPVFGAVDNVGMTFNLADPFICAQVKTEYYPHRKDR